MKLYTKRGDEGLTDLFGGQRVPKDAPRVEAYGAVDELNSFVGLAAAACEDAALKSLLHDIQSRLFEIGADLATPCKPGEEAAPGAIPRIGPEHVAELERRIDAAQESAPPMRVFILPGGTELAARLHVCRTVCRRVERLCVTLKSQEPIGDALLIYLNRLSDLFFALARQANHAAGVEDIPWLSPRQRDA